MFLTRSGRSTERRRTFVTDEVFDLEVDIVDAVVPNLTCVPRPPCGRLNGNLLVVLYEGVIAPDLRGFTSPASREARTHAHHPRDRSACT